MKCANCGVIIFDGNESYAKIEELDKLIYEEIHEEDGDLIQELAVQDDEWDKDYQSLKSKFLNNNKDI